MAKTAVIVGLEGLGTNLLGAYGCPWIDTPSLNSFAAHSLTADQFWIESDELELNMRSCWYGWHALEKPAMLGSSLMQLLTQKGLQSELATDVPRVTKMSGAEDFEWISLQECDRFEAANDPSNGWLVQWMESAVAEWLTRENRPSMLWLHGQGWLGPWDVPYEFREAIADEEDPDPPHDWLPPNFEITKDTDPDLVVGWSQAAAAQVHVLEAAWDMLLTSLKQFNVDDDCLVVLLGMGGYPVGQHGRVGPRGSLPFSELAHVPCIMKPGNQMVLGRRFANLSQTSDLWQTLLQWFDVPSFDSHEEPPRRCSRSLWTFDSTIDHGDWIATTKTERGTSLRSKNWGLVKENEGDSAMLFVHPEDRWQQNNVSSRAGDVVLAASESQQQWLDFYHDATNEQHPDVPSLLKEAPE